MPKEDEEIDPIIVADLEEDEEIGPHNSCWFG